MEALLNPSEYYRFIFVMLAAIFNSVMDSVENEHVKDTVFNKYRPSFWSKRDSWNKAKVILRYKVDAWHISKSLMLICIGVFCCFPSHIHPIINFTIFGICWLATFNLFYNTIFKK